ncbi:duf833 domain protein [Phlyctema vagabunda]|uniref:Duf833 domain protein n=1 Tax=Phlyctema vagabunda TaxID=108571 RepID=A0ABR4PBC0_9HELO
MCIAIVTTAHPSYALIILDNRDEFILRPTSLPHWWESQKNYQQVLSSRDLQRAEQGTWLGITKTGNFAVLTNYRETDTHDAEHPVQGLRSRGGMVTAWLGADKTETTSSFVKRLFENGGVKGVGGFSLLAGKLRKRGHKDLDPIAIISNRSDGLHAVPWIAGERDEVHALSNTSFHDPEVWPKVEMGKEKTLETVKRAAKDGWSEEKLVDALYEVLDSDTLPPAEEGEEFEQYISQLRKSIFIRPIGSTIPEEIPKADVIAAAKPLNNGTAEVKIEPDGAPFMTGIYGTQRQTIILVDWDGNVTYRERSLYDPNGNPLQRGTADTKYEFQIEGWQGDDENNLPGVRSEL